MLYNEYVFVIRALPARRKMTVTNQKERALEKLESEINKDIQK